METQEKTEAFKEPISYIKDEEIKKFAIKAIESMPDYFFVIPASSTGKYHPAYSLGEGGLLRHTIAAVRIAIELFRMEEYAFNDNEQDLIITSLILHDGWKSGKIQSSYSVVDHPLVAAKEINENHNLIGVISFDENNEIINNISSHMGQWNTARDGTEIMPKPRTRMQKFVHLCDYLASRKCLIMDFDVPLSKS